MRAVPATRGAACSWGSIKAAVDLLASHLKQGGFHMESGVSRPGMATDPAYPPGNAPTMLREAARYWWVFLVIGIAWVVAALVILQFNHASITTVSVILGIMFVAAAVQQFVLTAIADSLRWLYAIFGVLFAASAV